MWTWQWWLENRAMSDLQIGKVELSKQKRSKFGNRGFNNLAKVEKVNLGEILKHLAFHKGDTQHPYIHELKSSYRKQQMAKLLHKNTVTWKSLTMSHDLPKTNIPGSMTRDQGFLFFAQSCCLHDCVFLWIVMSDPEDKLLLMLNKGDGHGPWTHVYQKKARLF